MLRLAKIPCVAICLYATLRLPIDSSNSRPYSSVSLGSIPESIVASGAAVPISQIVDGNYLDPLNQTGFRTYLEPPESSFVNWGMVWISIVYAPDDLLFLGICKISKNCMKF